MLLLIRYFLKALALPPAINILLVLFALCIWRWYPRFAKFCMAFSFISLWVLSTPWVATNLHHLLESQYPPLATTNRCENAGAIVVLGGGSRRYSPEYGESNNVKPRTLVRLRYAATLSRRCDMGVIVSGGKVFSDVITSEADLMAAILENEFKVPVKWREDGSRTTEENAALTAVKLKQENIHSIVLVTSGAHMPRSVQSFQRHGIAVVPAPTAFLGKSTGDKLLDWIPQASSLFNSRAAIHEFLGLLVYRLIY